MDKFLLFFAGITSAAGIPYFFNGISGKFIVAPFFYKFLLWVPNAMFNTLWGLFLFFLAYLCIRIFKKNNENFRFEISLNIDFIYFMVGFMFTSVFLSLFFSNGGWR